MSIKYTMALAGMMIFIISATAYSIAPRLPEKYEKAFSDQQKPDIEYTIDIPGSDLGNGMYSPSRRYRIERVPREFYLQNAIYVKSKYPLEISGTRKSFAYSTLQNDIGDLDIKSIRAPFAGTERGNLLSSDKYGLSRVYEVSYAAPVDPYDVCRDLMNNPDVEYAVPVFVQKTDDYTPNDPRIGSQWMVNRIELKKAWDIEKGDKNIVIAIVDSGVDTDHEDLAANIWVNPDEIPDNDIDDDENGFVDDVNGWDFVGNISQAQAQSNAYQPDNNPKPQFNNNMHGTHCSGCAAGITDNGKGIASPAFNCTILPVKCGADNYNIRGIYRGYEGILYAAQMGADVINCSWGGPGYSPLHQDIINQAVDFGSVVVVASGNDGENIDYTEHYPSNYDNVLSVGATASNDKVAGFSNYGYKVTVYAPGQSIYSTMPNNSYQNQSGTSMASPVTAGVAGLLLSHRPDWTVKQVFHQIRSTSDNVLTSDEEIRPLLYGRINAYKALAYNGNNPSLSAPGVEYSNMALDGSGHLDDFDDKFISFDITNYLASVSDLKVTVTPVDPFIEISKSEFNIGVLSTNQTKPIDFRVTLKESNPWFHGDARLLFKYESGDYVDYEMVLLPIRLESDNLFSTLTAMPDWISPLYWHGAKSVSDGDFWVVGQSGILGGIFLHYTGSNILFNQLVQDPIYAIDAVSRTTAFAGTGPSSGNAAVYSTTDYGQNWSSKSVSGITGFINDIHFFNENEGIIFGDPKSGVWGIGRTTDGGGSWKAVTGTPSPTNGEAGYVGCANYLDDNAWFGTNQGRVYYSTDKGKSWAVSIVFNGGFIHRIGFMDEDFGIAVYSENSDQDAAKWAATTTDGGQNWKTRIYNFTENGLNPVYFFSPPEYSSIAMLCSGGEIYETKDLGRKWTPILSQQSVGAQTGVTIKQDGYKMRLWQASYTINYLDFAYIPDNAKKELTVESGETIEFDTVEVEKSKLRFATIKNTGDVPVNILLAEIIPGSGVEEDEFEFSFAPPDKIDVGASERFRVKFTPKDLGSRTAQLHILSDLPETDANIYIDLLGYGSEPVSVREYAEEEGYALWQPTPNPVLSDAMVAFELPEAAHARLDIFDQAGKLVMNIHSQTAAPGRHEISLNTGGLASGVYYLKLSAANKVLMKKFIVER